MGLATRQRTRWVLVALLLLVAAAIADSAVLWRAAQTDAAIRSAQADPGPPAAPGGSDAQGAPAELRFARAYALAQAHGASGADDAALNRYRSLQSDPRLGDAARFNSANLLVRQAVKVQASIQPGQAIALLELAKETYRDVLRSDPSQWDARYNLERAQRLLPDPEAEEAEPISAERNRERAATTMRGYAPGLP